jgi:ribosomal protein L16/L10AE
VLIYELKKEINGILKLKNTKNPYKIAVKSVKSKTAKKTLKLAILKLPIKFFVSV